MTERGDATAGSTARRSGARRVLMLLYHFPPIGGISMARNIRNVQYLPEHGWQPVVVTPAAADSNVEDPGSLALVPSDVTVERTGYVAAGDLQPIVRLARRMSGAVRAIGGPPIARSTGPAEGSAPPSRASAAAGPGPAVASSRFSALRRLLFFPDNQAGWLPFAVVAAVRAHRASPVDAVYATFPPMTSLVAAAAVARICAVPLVAEFRDPWIGNSLEAPPPWLIRQLRRKVERWVVRSAAEVVAVTPRLARMLERRYPGLAVRLVPNGYQLGEATGVRRVRGAGEPLRIVYTGTLDRPAELTVFLDGLALAATRRPDLHDRLCIEIFGNVAPACRDLVSAAEAGPANGIVTIRGFVPRVEALAALAAADAALVLLGDGPGMDLFMPGKLFDDLGADRQVLAMLTAGDARELLAELDWGIVCAPVASEVADAIEHLLATPAPDRRADPSGRYDRRTLAGRLAGVLDDAVAAVEPGAAGAAR
jgi:glycosyltransferase involved in cell wall biosynthesis